MQYPTAALQAPAIRHHPDDGLMLSFATGALPAGSRRVMAAHLELCPACRAGVAALRAVGGVLLEEQPPAAMREDALSKTLARIDARQRQEEASPPATALPRKVAPPPPLPSGAVWPRALADCQATRWRRIGPGMRWSRITVPHAPEANLFALRIGPGRYLPRHTHRGVEATQVIHGHFHDGRALFGPGDFDLADDQVHHQPVVQEGSECICIAAVEGRVAFDSLMARWLGSLVGM